MMILDRKKVHDLESRLSPPGNKINLSGFLVMSDWRGDIWLASRELADLEFSKFNVVSIGIKIAEISRDGKLKLNRNGSWIASHNIPTEK
jgi:hypothetical protein